MNAIITTVLPVFGLIVLGYVFAKARIIDAAAGRGMTVFVFTIAIPAFLFRTVATLAEPEASPWMIWVVFFGGIAVIWIITALVSRLHDSISASGGAAASMATGFGNLALLGTPLAISHFGTAAAVPVGLILSIHAAVLWFAATLHREIARSSQSFSFTATVKELGLQLASNGIVIALIAAALWRLTGLGLHAVPDRMLEMLGIAGVPTALVALGVSLAGFSLRGSWGGMLTLIGLKMVAFPVVVYVIAHYAVALPPLWTKVAVLFAAMPTGANAFLFAQKHDEAAPAVSGAVAIGTGLAAISASIVLWLADLNYI